MRPNANRQKTPSRICSGWKGDLVAKSASVEGYEIQWSQSHYRSWTGKLLVTSFFNRRLIWIWRLLFLKISKLAQYFSSPSIVCLLQTDSNNWRQNTYNLYQLLCTPVDYLRYKMDNGLKAKAALNALLVREYWRE